jgi:secondary thiamine-phosphate synthase enzyme
MLSAIRSTKADTIATARLTVETSGEGFFEITAEVKRFLKQAGARNGTVLIYLRHTSASVVIQENADPDVRIDLLTALRRLAPADAGWVHDVEGPDDMPGHVKSMLNGVSLHVPVDDGNLALGAWQGIYVAEHRITPHRREVILQFCGSCADSTTARD